MRRSTGRALQGEQGGQPVRSRDAPRRRRTPYRWETRPRHRPQDGRGPGDALRVGGSRSVTCAARAHDAPMPARSATTSTDAPAGAIPRTASAWPAPISRSTVAPGRVAAGTSPAGGGRAEPVRTAVERRARLVGQGAGGRVDLGGGHVRQVGDRPRPAEAAGRRRRRAGRCRRGSPGRRPVRCEVLGGQLERFRGEVAGNQAHALEAQRHAEAQRERQGDRAAAGGHLPDHDRRRRRIAPCGPRSRRSPIRRAARSRGAG